MLALCVDDEELLLNALVRAAEASRDVTEVAKFTLCSRALEWAQTHRPDIAFLDIRMRGMSGIELAEKLVELYGDLPIIFCTGFPDYALDAFRIHAYGYLMKPVTAEALQKEIDTVKKRIAARKTGQKLTVQCFGNFEAFCGDRQLPFKRRRSMELLAYLVDRRGATVTAKEICAVLWENDGDDRKNIAYLYKLIGDLRDTLSAVGAEGVLVHEKKGYAVKTELLDCDYYRYLQGDPDARRQFSGEYMVQYSWAEETAAALR